MTIKKYSHPITLKQLDLHGHAYQNKRLGKNFKRMTSRAQGIIYHADLLINDLGLESPYDLGSRWGIFVATAYSHIENSYRFMDEAYETSPKFISPIYFPNAALNSLSGWLSVAFNVTGPNSTIYSLAASNPALNIATNALLAQTIDYALVIKTTEYTQLILENIPVPEDQRIFSETLELVILTSTPSDTGLND